MRIKIAALVCGIVLAAILVPSTSAHADTPRGCSLMQDMGNNFADPIGYGQNVGGYLDFYGTSNEDLLCNVSVPINGVFEITDSTTHGCVGADIDTGVIEVESSAACAIDGGEGYPWDEWTVYYTTNVYGWTIFELRNVASDYCLYDDQQQPAVEASCIKTDQFEWFYWPLSGLPGADDG